MYKSKNLKEQFKESRRLNPKLRLSFSLYYYSWKKRKVDAIESYLVGRAGPMNKYIKRGIVAHELAEEQIEDDELPGEGEVSREKFFETDLDQYGDVKIVGVADVLRGDTLIDYKTGNLTAGKYKEQLSLYKWILEREGIEVNNYYLMKLELNDGWTEVEITDKMVIPALETDKWDKVLEEMVQDITYLTTK